MPREQAAQFQAGKQRAGSKRVGLKKPMELSYLPLVLRGWRRVWEELEIDQNKIKEMEKWGKYFYWRKEKFVLKEDKTTWLINK